MVNQIEHRSPYLINAPVQADRTGDSIRALMENFTAFNTTAGVTEAERERTVHGNIRQLAGRFETSGAVLNALRSNDLFRRPDTTGDHRRRYHAMNAGEMTSGPSPSRPSLFVWWWSRVEKVFRTGGARPPLGPQPIG